MQGDNTKLRCIIRRDIYNKGVIRVLVGQAENSPRRPRTAYSAEALVEDDRSPIYAYIART